MKIGIGINEVLRVGQLTYTYTKYIDEDCAITEGDVTSLNLIEFF
jgi:hypothetical protein